MPSQLRLLYFISGASDVEISFAMSHSNIKIIQNCLKQFPIQFSDVAIGRFADGWDI